MPKPYRQRYGLSLTSDEIDADQRDHSAEFADWVERWKANHPHPCDETEPKAAGEGLDKNRSMCAESEPAGYINMRKMEGPYSLARRFSRVRPTPETDCQLPDRPTKTRKQKNPQFEEDFYVTCLICGVSLKSRRLPRHLRKAHQVTAKQATKNRLMPTETGKPQSKNGSVATIAVVTQAPHTTTAPVQSKANAKGNCDTCCPLCKAPLKSSNLPRHFRKVHPGAEIPGNTPSPKARSKPRSDQDAITSPVVDTDNTRDVTIADITDQFYDEQYGDKYVGQSWPESSGAYGSLPLYDDYSDEGWPD